MTSEEKRSWAVRQLQDKQTETGRIPLKSDFDAAALSRIKEFFGQWPRALEAAGLKEAKPVAVKNRRRRAEKRQKGANVCKENTETEQTPKTEA